MDKLSEYMKAGYEGIDLDLATSLYEYGLIWHENDQDGDIKFIYAIGHDGSKLNLFDYGFIQKDVNLYTEYDWVDWNDIYSFTGLDKDEFDTMPLPLKISDLLSYYGSENIFGTSYQEGSIIKNDTE